MKIKKEFNFVLPQNVVNEEGRLTKVHGVMRLIRVKDLIDVHRDSRVQEKPAYLYVVLLSRVILKMGNARIVNSKVIEDLSVENFAFLIDFLNEINHQVLRHFPVKCSNCQNVFSGGVHLLGEI